MNIVYLRDIANDIYFDVAYFSQRIMRPVHTSLSAAVVLQFTWFALSFSDLDPLFEIFVWMHVYVYTLYAHVHVWYSSKTHIYEGLKNIKHVHEYIWIYHAQRIGCGKCYIAPLATVY